MKALSKTNDLVSLGLVVCIFFVTGCEPTQRLQRNSVATVCPSRISLGESSSSIDDYSIFASLGPDDMVTLVLGEKVSNSSIQKIIAQIEKTKATVSFDNKTQANCGKILDEELWYPAKPLVVSNDRTTAIFDSKESITNYVSILEDMNATFHAYEIDSGAVVDVFDLSEADKKELCFRARKCVRTESKDSLPEQSH
ncbi:MAG: hypothetical protein AAF385_02130 [Pseudomonadota bacterium]